MREQHTVILEREVNGYISLCSELDIVSQGDIIGEAHRNLREALELFYETASPAEIQTRLHKEIYVTQVEVAVFKVLTQKHSPVH
jgi:predicted RNase H-like HicB family nuclease